MTRLQYVATMAANSIPPKKPREKICMAKKRHTLPELSPAQQEIMDCIWQHGELSASGVRRHIGPSSKGRPEHGADTFGADGREGLAQAS